MRPRPTPDVPVPDGVRLQKVLARAGWGSRRACDDLIAARRVRVNGEVAVLGRRVDPATDTVEVDGVTIGVQPGLVWYLLNKPAGVVSTASDPQGRTTVVELVPDEPRVFSVGRLDVDTEGLLVLTNDGVLTQHLTHPSHGVPKTYLAQVRGVPSDAALRALREGIDLDDGPTAPARATVVQRHGDDAAIEITIHEGRNRQVRRMCDAIGHPVLRLVRTKIGGLVDATLAPGAWRLLSKEEVRALYEASTRAGTSSEPGASTAPGASTDPGVSTNPGVSANPGASANPGVSADDDG